MANQTKDWDLYEAGKKYNNSLKPNYYNTVDTNLAFFVGDQWRNVETYKLPKPVFNIIKNVITHKVASLTSTNTKVQFEPLAYREDDPNPQMQMEQDASEIASAEVENLFEKFKMEHRIRDALFDAAICGDVAAHFYFDVSKKPYGGAFDAVMGAEVKGEICMELVDGTQVMFGNANNSKVEDQPYIIISGRAPIEDLKAEAKRYKANSNPDGITSDSEYNEMAGDSGKIEVDADGFGKALYIIVYRRDKKTGTIRASKSVKEAYIYKDIDTGLDNYPVAWLPWEKQKNQYHGRAICTEILPNQIFINRMFAMVMYHLMLSAFPKAIYDADKINLWTNEIGLGIPVRNLQAGESIRNVAGYLEPGNMSNQIVQVIELAIQYTKETLGISDVSLGNVKPENTSAIIAVQKSAAIPLENIRGNLHEFVEDIGKILLNMMGTYYGLRPIVMSQDGQKSVIPFDFSIFKNLWLNIRVDVGDSSYWSEIASVQTLDNLLNQNRIEFIDYLERVPDDYIPKKAELITKINQFMQQQALQQQMMEEQQAMMQQQQMMGGAPGGEEGNFNPQDAYGQVNGQ